MATFNFYLTDSKAIIPTSIYLQIQSRGKKAKFFVKHSILPKNWNFKKQQTKGLINTPELNVLLGSYLDAAKKANLRLLESEGISNPHRIKEELIIKFFEVPEGKGETQRITDIYTFKNTYLEILTNTKGQKGNAKVTNSTIIASRQTFEILKDFHDFTKISLDFSNINLVFHSQLVDYLERERNYRANTVAKHINRLKTFLNVALELGYNTNVQFKSRKFSAPKEQVNNIFLTEKELNSMQTLVLTSKPHLDRVRDIFIIGAYTGLRYSDYSNLQNEDFEKINNEIYLNKTIRKTNDIVSIPILPKVKKVFDKYTINGVINLPKSISNQKFNQYLKEVGKLIPELNKPFAMNRTTGGLKTSVNKPKWQLLVTHTARRSFATNMYLRGISPNSIMGVTGHKTESSFYTYIQMNPKQKAVQFMNEFNNSKVKLMA